MNAQQAIAKWLEANVTAVDLDQDYRGDTDAIHAIWLAANAAPSFVADSVAYAVEAAMYQIRHEEAIYVIDGKEFPLNVESYRWNIQQAINNRSEGKSMVAAAHDYVENLLQNI